MQAMTSPTYHFLHLVGVLLLFVGFGGIAGGDNASRRKAMMYHGLGLVVLLVSGFGSLAKTPFPYTAPWVLIMYATWLALGALPILAKRGVLPAKWVVKIALLLGFIAAYCGYFKVPAG